MSKYQFRVDVKPAYQAEQSDPAQGLYVFSYTIRITNTGQVPAQLVSRTWNVNDANGHTERVRGLGVVGQQPLLKPGEQFEYSSWTRLATPHGQMRGTYFCITEEAQPFEAQVPEFELVFPGLLH